MLDAEPATAGRAEATALEPGAGGSGERLHAAARIATSDAVREETEITLETLMKRKRFRKEQGKGSASGKGQLSQSSHVPCLAQEQHLCARRSIRGRTASRGPGLRF